MIEPWASKTALDTIFSEAINSICCCCLSNSSFIDLYKSGSVIEKKTLLIEDNFHLILKKNRPGAQLPDGHTGFARPHPHVSPLPETPIILDHLCGVRIKDGVWPEQKIRALCRMARYPGVMIKLGPFQALGNGKAPYLDLLPLIKRIFDAFGPERIMWESDSGGPVAMQDPHNDFAASIALIRDHADFLSPRDKEQILVKTAADFFFRK